MIKGFLNILSGQGARRSRILRVALMDPLQRLSQSDYFAQFRPFKTLAQAIAKQTHLMVESLLVDDAVADWNTAGESATLEQVSDIAIFCSHSLVQFTLNHLKGESGLEPLNAELRADVFDLVRLMYGDFGASALGGLSFNTSLATRDLYDAQDMRHLTRLLDQLLEVEKVSDQAQRELKIQKLRDLFTKHRRAFAYTLHGVASGFSRR